MSRWIKIYEDTDQHDVFQDAGTWQLFTFLLMKAVVAKASVRGIQVKRGQCVYSRSYLAYVCSTTEVTIKKRIDKLVKLGCITIESAGQAGTIITITNYQKYQGDIDRGLDGGLERGLKINPPTPQGGQIINPQPNPNTKIDRYNDNNNSCYTEAEAKSEAREQTIRSYMNDPRWMQDISQLTMMPMKMVRDELNKFILQLRVTNDTDYENIQARMVSWLRKGKRIDEIEKAKQNGRNNNTSGTNSANDAAANRQAALDHINERLREAGIQLES